MFRGQYLFLYKPKFLLESSDEKELVLNCISFKYVDSNAPKVIASCYQPFYVLPRISYRRICCNSIKKYVCFPSHRKLLTRSEHFDRIITWNYYIRLLLLRLINKIQISHYNCVYLLCVRYLKNTSTQPFVIELEFYQKNI